MFLLKYFEKLLVIIVYKLLWLFEILIRKTTRSDIVSVHSKPWIVKHSVGHTEYVGLISSAISKLYHLGKQPVEHKFFRLCFSHEYFNSNIEWHKKISKVDDGAVKQMNCDLGRFLGLNLAQCSARWSICWLHWLLDISSVSATVAESVWLSFRDPASFTSGSLFFIWPLQWLHTYDLVSLSSM